MSESAFLEMGRAVLGDQDLPGGLETFVSNLNVPPQPDAGAQSGQFSATTSESQARAGKLSALMIISSSLPQSDKLH